MKAVRIRAGERREIISGPGGVGPELVFTAERDDGGTPTGTVEETRSAMVGEAVNRHPLKSENVFRLGRAARSRVRTRFRIAVIPDQNVTVRIVRGYASPARILMIAAAVSVVLLAAIASFAYLG